MPDIFLYSDEITDGPFDVRLNDPTVLQGGGPPSGLTLFVRMMTGIGY
jgi:hypothetical protein